MYHADTLLSAVSPQAKQPFLSEAYTKSSNIKEFLGLETHPRILRIDHSTTLKFTRVVKSRIEGPGDMHNNNAMDLPGCIARTWCEKYVKRYHFCMI
jgi:hypothetical protein